MAVGERYLAFLNHAQVSGGGSHNRLSYDRHWTDHAGVGDWWGRSLWGSGTAAARGWSARLRADALAHFDVGAATRSPWPRAMAFAALGAAEVLTAHPDHAGARHLLADAAALLRPGGLRHTGALPWRLALARTPVAVRQRRLGGGVDGRRLGSRRRRLVDDGIRLLEWLLETETVDGHLSLTPVGGWAPGEPRPGYDQQPIEAASLADACTRAFVLTGDGRYVGAVSRAVSWFLGDNDAQIPMSDPDTGGGYDGLELGGRNDNQGAESTLALVSTLQQAATLQQGLRLVGWSAVTAGPTEAWVQRLSPQLGPDPRRVLARLFVPGQEMLADGESRAGDVIDRIMALSDEDVAATLEATLAGFGSRHRELETILEEHYDLVAHRLEGGSTCRTSAGS